MGRTLQSRKLGRARLGLLLEYLRDQNYGSVEVPRVQRCVQVRSCWTNQSAPECIHTCDLMKEALEITPPGVPVDLCTRRHLYATE
jgi:hypothetical protein